MLEAARQSEAGAIQGGGTLLGVPWSSRTLRLRAEAALRTCARLSRQPLQRIAYVDQANRVRPRTLL